MENHAETTFSKESSSVSLQKETKQSWGGRGLVTKFPLTPALISTANLDNLYQASQECRRNINWKDSVLGFQANLGFNLIQLRNELLNGTYKLRPYKRFVIYEPKKRDIEATCHRDRIVTRSLCNTYLYEALTRHFVYDNGANQKGKGTEFTRKRFKCLLHRHWERYGCEGWVCYVDIQAFFRFNPARCRSKGDQEESARPVCLSLLRNGNGVAPWRSRRRSRKRIVSTDGLNGP
jgi:hypothetical protein